MARLDNPVVQRTPSGAPVDDALAREYEKEERKFDALSQEVQLPFLEVRLYRKYFIQYKTSQRLDNLRKIVLLLQQHRSHTIHILKTINEREAVMSEIRAKSTEFAAKRLSTLEVQSQVLQLLYAHQQVTLRVVEAIQRWRSLLTRPYPFHWNRLNYLLHIIEDCDILDTSGLRSILPLRLKQFPLCSNISSLRLFAPGEQQKAAEPPQNGVNRRLKVPDRDEPMHARLLEAESVIFDERGLQEKVMKELAAISAAGYFVPVLNIPDVIPSCATGIRISNVEWTKQLTAAINDVVDADVRPHREADEAAPRTSDTARSPSPRRSPTHSNSPRRRSPSPQSAPSSSSRNSSRSPSSTGSTHS